MRLTKENVERARATIALYPQPRSALLPVLHLLQEQDGYLTEDGMEHVGELIGITAAEVYGTASFYDMFFTHPVGTYLVSICTNIACLLNGGYELLEHAEETLGVKAGSTTPDGRFTLEEVECIGLCGNAPCLTVNWRFFGDVTEPDFDTLVEDLGAGRLAETVPPHGTLSRVRRSVGLKAVGQQRPSEARGGALLTAGEIAAPPPKPAPAPTPAAAPAELAEAPAREPQPQSTKAAKKAAKRAGDTRKKGDGARGSGGRK